ncbi:hypothetical protein KIPB_010496 [Kipferlia bialata]|uniref:Uncharacterized protein n=1 Tax=Kipferlia bialata TaxID=797122 RepID=A0A391NYU4_9EUKA|nr:hypothetical protein KIPB_010496 [Kipferlia bialata]|eukprot:g10496.t1
MGINAENEVDLVRRRKGVVTGLGTTPEQKAKEINVYLGLPMCKHAGKNGTGAIGYGFRLYDADNANVTHNKTTHDLGMKMPVLKIENDPQTLCFADITRSSNTEFEFEFQDGVRLRLPQAVYADVLREVRGRMVSSKPGQSENKKWVRLDEIAKSLIEEHNLFNCRIVDTFEGSPVDYRLSIRDGVYGQDALCRQLRAPPTPYSLPELATPTRQPSSPGVQVPRPTLPITYSEAVIDRVFALICQTVKENDIDLFWVGISNGVPSRWKKKYRFLCMTGIVPVTSDGPGTAVGILEDDLIRLCQKDETLSIENAIGGGSGSLIGGEQCVYMAYRVKQAGDYPPPVPDADMSALTRSLLQKVNIVAQD